MQDISFNILGRTFWKESAFLYEHAYLSVILSTIFSIMIGVVTYYLVEKPSYNALMRLFARNRNENV